MTKTRDDIAEIIYKAGMGLRGTDAADALIAAGVIRQPVGDGGFEEWYFSQWSHGEITPVHHAHKEGCRKAWDAARSNKLKI